MKYFCIIFYFTPFFLFAQPKYIFDAQTNEPIPFVNIGVKDSYKGTNTNYDGTYTLDSLDPNLVVLISHVGYQSYSSLIKDLPDTLYLTLSNYILDEVIVSSESKKYTSKKISNWRKKTVKVYSGMTQFALFIPNQEKNPSFIASITIKMDNNIEYSPYIRFRFYENSNSQPGNDYYRKSYLTTVKRKQVTFDFKEAILIPEDGFFLGIDLLAIESINSEKMPNNQARKLKLHAVDEDQMKMISYYKNFGANQWKRLMRNDNISPLTIKHEILVDIEK